MSTQEISLEERVSTLEQKFSELERRVVPQRREKDWRRTFGMFKDDPGFDEMIRLGREYRESQMPADDEC